MKKFNLNEALDGKPVKLRCGNKAFILHKLENPEHKSKQLIGYVCSDDSEIPTYWSIEGKIGLKEVNYIYDILGMFEEPKRFINDIEVPEPVTMEDWVDGAYYWYLNFYCPDFAIKGQFYKDSSGDAHLVKKGFVFKTKEGAEAMSKALLNYKVEYKNDDTYKNNYDANNGWIDINEKLPPFETEVLGRCIVDNEELIIIVSREVGDGEYWFSPVNFSGVCTDETVEVSHWQPLPKPPQA